MIDDVKNFIDFVKTASTQELILTALFVFVILWALAFEWLWLRERNQRLRLERSDHNLRADATATATFNKEMKLASRESLGKLALKASRIASCIFPSTHQTKRPDARDTAKVIKPLIESECNTKLNGSQSQITRR